MADGTHKNIEDIRVGDKVKSFDGEKVISATVTKTIQRKDPIITLNGVLRAAPDQLVYLANGKTEYAFNLKKTDQLLGANGNVIAIETITSSPELVDTYDFALDNYGSFYADGYLVQSLTEQVLKSIDSMDSKLINISEDLIK